MTGSPSSDAEFQRLFKAHRDAMWAYCVRRLHRDDVPDAVAEVFLVAWRRWDQAPLGGEERPWLYGVARNVVRNFGRSSRRRMRLDARLASVAEPASEPPDSQVVRREQEEQLLAAVLALSPLEQELLRLRTWEELSHADIAQVVGRSVRSVESRLARIRRKLVSQLNRGSNRSQISPRPVEEGGER